MGAVIFGTYSGSGDGKGGGSDGGCRCGWWRRRGGTFKVIEMKDTVLWKQ